MGPPLDGRDTSLTKSGLSDSFSSSTYGQYMGIAAVALAIRLMPAAVYPVPDGTPSLLYAFIGTGGSLRALAVSLLCFAVDVAIFIPFVHLSNKVQHGLKEEGESNEVQ